MIHVLHQPATAQQIVEMLEIHESFIKVAVDVQRRILAGGGEFHADCEAVLLEEGSRRTDIWGADWLPTRKEIRFGALINIRSHINKSMVIQDPAIGSQVEDVIRRLLDI